MAGEFDLIRRYFLGSTPQRADVLLGIGDDCALLRVPEGRILAVSSDTLVSGRHFLPDVAPAPLGHKALAVNLSDLAAMGAQPAWASLCLTLPQADETWLGAFMQGFTQLAGEYGVQLIGGDTTRGPLSISVTVQGFVDPQRTLRRDAAQAGDLIYVSGTLGDAGLALRARQGGVGIPPDGASLGVCLDRPSPRVALGLSLPAFSRCAIDISDGLVADLRHICDQSTVGALLELEYLPLSAAVRVYIDETGDWSLPLSAGDDYELLFTVQAGLQEDFERAARTWDVPVTRVGVIEQRPGVRIRDAQGRVRSEVNPGYDHFRT